MSALAESGLDLIAEDLGVVPDFLRPSLERLGAARLPGAALGARLARAGRAVPRPADVPAASARP